MPFCLCTKLHIKFESFEQCFFHSQSQMKWIRAHCTRTHTSPSWTKILFTISMHGEQYLDALWHIFRFMIRWRVFRLFFFSYILNNYCMEFWLWKWKFSKNWNKKKESDERKTTATKIKNSNEMEWNKCKCINVRHNCSRCTLQLHRNHIRATTWNVIRPVSMKIMITIDNERKQYNSNNSLII